MLLATGDARYADCMERALYNATLVGISLKGTEYFYSNRMESRKGAVRRPWFGCSCCPPNVHRLLGSLQQYLYTVDDSGVQVHLYNTSTLRTRTPGGQDVVLTQTTDYPRSGDVKITVNSAGRFAVSLRIPAWAKGASVTCGGKPFGGVAPGRYVRIDRRWKTGDTIALKIPMKVRLAEGNPRVPDQKGKVAILRGPLVYCAEGVDNPKLDLFALSIPADGKFTESPGNEKMLGGVVPVKGGALNAEGRPVKLTTIPYNVWANRKQSPVRIWFPREVRDE